MNYNRVSAKLRLWTQSVRVYSSTRAASSQVPLVLPVMDPGSAPPLEGGSDASAGDAVVFGVVTVSDRASAGTYSDLSGPAILQFFSEAIKSRCGLIYNPRSAAMCDGAVLCKHVVARSALKCTS